MIIATSSCCPLNGTLRRNLDITLARCLTGIIVLLSHGSSFFYHVEIWGEDDGIEI